MFYTCWPDFDKILGKKCIFWDNAPVVKSNNNWSLRLVTHAQFKLHYITLNEVMRALYFEAKSSSHCRITPLGQRETLQLKGQICLKYLTDTCTPVLLKG